MHRTGRCEADPGRPTFRLVSASDDVLCSPGRPHVAESARLSIVTGRYSDMARWSELASEPEAQRWLGWRVEHCHPARLGEVADPVTSRQPVMRPSRSLLFFAGIHRDTDCLVVGVTVERVNGVCELGGAVHRSYRGQGYGREALGVVCDLAHRHFGIDRLRAGCERANTASRRWLTGAGFVTAAGPANHTLPDGRVISSLWFERFDPSARTACDQLRPVRRLAVAVRQLFTPAGR